MDRKKSLAYDYWNIVLKSAIAKLLKMCRKHESRDFIDLENVGINILFIVLSLTIG